MKIFLTLTALIEAATGISLLMLPNVLVKLLLGAEISGVAIPLGRVAGIALLALGVACWLAGGDVRSRAAGGLVTAMLLYNFGVAVILGAAGMQLQPVGIALWPVVILHVTLTVGCLNYLRRRRTVEPA